MPGSSEPPALRAPALAGPVLMAQAWRSTAFLHWRVPPAAVARWMPPGVEPDLHDGSAWVGLVPFTMVGAGVGRGPAVPWLGSFLETNVRTYGRDADGRRGVVFCSLDADRLAVVLGARLVFGLPYRWSRLATASRVTGAGEERVWTAGTPWPGPRGRRSRVVVRAGAPLGDADGGDIGGAGDEPLRRFLTARYGLHVAHLGRTWWVPNAHEPWPLHRAELVALDDALLGAAGFPDLAARAPDSALWSPGVRTTFGLPRLLPRRPPSSLIMGFPGACHDATGLEAPGSP